MYAHEDALWDRRLAAELAVAQQRGADNRAVAQIHADARELQDNSNIDKPFELYDRLFEDAMVGSMDKFYTVDPYSGEWVPDLAKYGNSAAEWNAAILEDLEGRRGGIEEAIRGIAQVQKWSAFEIDQFTEFFWSRAAVAQVVNVGPAGSGVPGEVAAQQWQNKPIQTLEQLQLPPTPPTKELEPPPTSPEKRPRPASSTAEHG